MDWTFLGYFSNLEDDGLEMLWIELKIKRSKPYFLGINYRPPKANHNSFFVDLEQNIEKVLDISDNVLIVGDLNCNMLNDNPLSKKIDMLCENLQLIQNISKPTRVTPHSKTLIDLIFTSKNIGTMQAGVQTLGLSDHSLIYIVLKEIVPKCTPKISHYTTFRNFEVDRFVQDIEQCDWSDFYDKESNVEAMWGEFKQSFIKICDKHAPFVNVKKKLKRAPWITDEYLKIARERDYNHKQFSRTRQENFWNKFKYFRNKANNLNRKLKQQYYDNKFQRTSKTNIKEKWKIMKDLLPKKDKCETNQIIQGDETITDAHEIANIFNEYFNNIASYFTEDCDTPFEMLENVTESDSQFLFSDIDEEFVIKELQSLESEKSYGIDGIHPKLLKLAANQIAKPLTVLFNCSLKTGQIPIDFKTAKIVPIHKSGNKLQTGNYRPISILSVVSKILEKAVHSQLYSYLEQYHLLSECQSGFRPLHSTSTCILDITEYLLENMNSGSVTGGMFLDLRKAFDVICHKILIEKLSSFGIKGMALKWFKTYITERRQCVSIAGKLSDFLLVKSGVPQGSTLGPLMFSMFINDMPNVKLLPSSKLVLYADDTAIFCNGKTWQEVENKLQCYNEMVKK